MKVEEVEGNEMIEGMDGFKILEKCDLRVESFFFEIECNFLEMNGIL